MRENFKKDINNFLKEIQKNTGKQVEDLKGKQKKKSLKEFQESYMQASNKKKIP